MKLKLPQVGSKKPKEIEVKPQFRTRALSASVVGEVLSEYDVGQSHVIIANTGEKALYLIQEPPLSENEQRLYSMIMEALYYSFKPVEKDVQAHVEQFVWEAAEDLSIVDEVRKSYEVLRYYIFRDSVGYGVADVLLNDDEIEEISCEGYGKPIAIVHRQFPQFDWLDTNVVFENEDILKKYVQRLVQKAGATITTSVPMVDAITPEQHRLAATLGNEISLPGSTFDLRKFPKEPFSIGHLLQMRSLSPLLASYYWLLMEEKGFVFVLGSTGSGKTTTMNALISMLNPRLKITTIEETPELLIPHVHWERLHSRTSYTASVGQNRFDISLFDLTRLSLRLRPDYIIVGEARGEEISTLFQAAATGHGALSSFHADSPEAALARMSAPPLNVGRASQMLIWSMLMMNRIRRDDGSVVRRAMSSTEIDQNGNLLPLFRWNAKDDTIYPTDALEVVKKSYRLKSIANLKGWDDEDTARELEARSTFLENLVKSGHYRYADVASAIAKFYEEKYSKTK